MLNMLDTAFLIKLDHLTKWWQRVSTLPPTMVKKQNTQFGPCHHALVKPSVATRGARITTRKPKRHHPTGNVPLKLGTRAGGLLYCSQPAGGAVEVPSSHLHCCHVATVHSASPLLWQVSKWDPAEESMLPGRGNTGGFSATLMLLPTTQPSQ